MFSNDQYPTKPLRIVDALERMAEVGTFSGWGITQTDSNGRPIEGSEPKFLQSTKLQTLGYYDCLEYFGNFMNPSFTCAVPADSTTGQCTEWDNWEYQTNAFLSGFPVMGEQIFETFEEAQKAAVKQADVGGITLDWNGYTLRAGSEFKFSEFSEESWLKPEHPCPECVQLEDWEFAADSYLSGLAADNGKFYVTLEDAQINALRFPDAGGVTEVSGFFQVRAGTEFEYSPSGERSWLKPSTPCESHGNSRRLKSSVCSGDTGGPLVVNDSGEERILGQASWINPDCDESYPVIFSNNMEKDVSNWIKYTAHLGY